jgi:hypothetical protein
VPDLAKAEMVEIDTESGDPVDGGNKLTVQFNPDTLKVTFANQLQTPSGAGDQRGTPARQYVGAGTTKLAVSLVFDVTAPLPGSDDFDDVRKLTGKVAFFITPKQDQQDRTNFKPPGVRFVWGSFQFDGLMDSMEETLEFFSSQGKPLRAGVSIALSQQRILPVQPRDVGPSASPSTPAGRPPGTSPLTSTPWGMSLPSLAINAGVGTSWQAIASANNIDNPRILAPGQLIDLNVNVGGGGGFF